MSAGFTAGQGSLPKVPGCKVKCDKCNAELSFENAKLPYKCPACKKVLRPVSDSIFSNLLFAFRRGFSISGRSTRKEYWTADIITSILLITLAILFIPLFQQWCESDGFINTPLYLILACCFGCFLIVLYQFCIAARRLHDIGRSAWWLFLASILGLVNILFYLVPLGLDIYSVVHFYNEHYELMNDLMFLDDEQCIMYAEELAGICSLDTPVVADWMHIRTRLNHPLHGYPIYFSLIDRTVFILNSILCVLLTIALFIDSQKGSNKYGLSHKYPVA